MSAASGGECDPQGFKPSQPKSASPNFVSLSGDSVGRTGYAIRLANAFDRATLGAQVGVFAALGFSAVSSIAAGLALVLILNRRRWVGTGLIGLGLLIWVGA